MKKISLLICCLQLGWLFGQIESSSLSKQSDSYGLSLKSRRGFGLSSDISGTFVSTSNSSAIAITAPDNETLASQTFNFFGISMNFGGGLLLDRDKQVSNAVVSGGKMNFGAGISWEHVRYLRKNHGIILGSTLSWTSFSNSVVYSYSDYDGMSNGGSITMNMGNGYRSNIVSIDFPVYYCYRIALKSGEINPYFGANLRVIAGLFNKEGYTSTSEEVELNNETYFSDYQFSYDLDRIAPMVQPTLGMSYLYKLKNGGHLKFSFDYKLYLKSTGKITASYDNTLKMKGGYLVTPDGPVPVEYTPVDWTTDDFYVNMSRFSLGLSYAFK